MDPKPPECFGTDPRARGLRVELSPQQSVVLAHEHFLYSEFKAGEDGDTLKLVFVTHVIELTGHVLRRLENGIQTRELAWVAARPERFRPPGNDRALITKISLRPLEAKTAADQPD
jgi:hypothetical protein